MRVRLRVVVLALALGSLMGAATGCKCVAEDIGSLLFHVKGRNIDQGDPYDNSLYRPSHDWPPRSKRRR